MSKININIFEDDTLISEEINETNRKQIMIPSDQLNMLVDYLKQDVQF
mgnify:CR=1 FL=1